MWGDYLSSGATMSIIFNITAELEVGTEDNDGEPFGDGYFPPSR